MQYPNIICLTGKRRSGKDTVAMHLAAAHDYTHLQFANPIYEMLAVMLPAFTRSELELYKNTSLAILGGNTIRYALQTLGTEWGRRIINEDIWAKLLCSQILQSGKSRYVISDCRFPNEWDAIVDIADKANMTRRLCRVSRFTTRSNAEQDGIDTHASETEMDQLTPDVVMPNNSTIAQLYQHIDRWLLAFAMVAAGEGEMT